MSVAGGCFLLRDVVVPLSIVAVPERFGGVRRADCLRGDLVIEGGRVIALRSGHQYGRPAGLVLPALVEPHCHLDKCHTVDRLEDGAGTLAEAIALQARDKLRWDEADLRERMRRGVSELASAGVGFARSHVDWPICGARVEPPLAWRVLSELVDEFRGLIRIQPSALVDIGEMAEPGRAHEVARIVQEASGVLGAFVLGHRETEAGLRSMFRAAERFDVPLDFHVDEGLDPALDGFSRIAEVALETAFAGPVLCGHACSLSSLTQPALSRVLDRAAQADLTVAVLPSTNLFLQGRRDGAPDRRGLAPLRDLQAAGVRTVVGVDNVRDAFCPVGRHDPLWALGLAVLAAQLPDAIGNHLPMITTDAARALRARVVTVDGARASDLIHVGVDGTAALLSGDGAGPTRLDRMALEAAA